MTEHTPGVPLGAWLADLPDSRLVRMLELRPDLAQPPPGSIAALAARSQARQSVRAATDDLNFLHLAVLEALLVLHADTTAVPFAELAAVIGDRAPQPAIAATLDDLRDRALAWGDPLIRVVAEAAAGLPWYPGQVILGTHAETPADVAAEIDALGDIERELLHRLLEGSPVGRTREAAPGTPPDRPVQRLLAAGLLHRLDHETVVLPRRVGQVLRGQQVDPASLSAPSLPTAAAAAARDVDGAAAGAVIDLLREFDVVIEALGTAPVPELRSGGLGVRDMKRLTKLTGVDDSRLGLILELAHAAGLIASGFPHPEPDAGAGPYWAPTAAADRFAEAPIAERWHLLAATWLDLPARPGLVGRRGPDNKPYAALSDALYSTAAAVDRRLLLELLAVLPPGNGVDAAAASETLTWRRPRWSARLQPEPVADLIEEAGALGIVGRGAITTPGRRLIAEDASAAVVAMAKVLPAPIDHFLLQADLTVVVPGPLHRGVAEELGVVATVESAGTAMVYRVSEASIRNALDTGRTAGGLHTFFGKHSKTPVPQGLTYLIDDVARRHGQLRVGMASSFVRCEDAALLAEAIATPATQRLQLRLLAPTVAVTQAPIADVLATLRSAGLTPAAEDTSGAIVDLRARGARVPASGHLRAFRPPASGPNKETLAAMVAVLRKVVALPTDRTRVDPARAMALLQQAAIQQQSVVIGYTDAAGVSAQRMVSPINVRGGQLVAFEPASGRIRDFAVHRVTSVVPADSV